jgi:uracil phosphoribosyltransferase
MKVVNKRKFMDALLKKLRNRKTNTIIFREVSQKIGIVLTKKLAFLLKKNHVKTKNIIIVIILRSAFALLEPALSTFPHTPVGVLGMKRDEYTFEPLWYYENLPPISKKNSIILIDPMLATGGSAEAAVLRLLKHSAKLENIYFMGIIGAVEGFERLSHFIPKQNIILAALDEKLNSKKYIVPGLGDFGDRYFGHKGKASVCEF